MHHDLLNKGYGTHLHNLLQCTSHFSDHSLLSCLLQKGFGNIDSEYWLGLDNIYNLTKQGDYRLLVELEDWVGKKVYAEYSSFRLESESEGFRIRLGTYQGNAGDSFSSHNGKPFTTLDRDRDTFSGKKSQEAEIYLQLTFYHQL